MGRRREGREIAVQFLYQIDLQKEDIEQQLVNFWKSRSTDGPMTPAHTRDFAEKIVRGILQHRAALDVKIASLAKNYSLPRIATVDRNVLRLGLYELLYQPEVPPVVVIDECLEIAKKFGSEESSRFVNGILDKAYGELLRINASESSWAPAGEPSQQPPASAPQEVLTRPDSLPQAIEPG